MKIEVSAIAGLTEFLDAAPQVTRQAAALAMNDITGGKGLTRYKKSIKSQVGFPAGYLEDSDKFGQTGFATPGNLVTKISARQRATSLARFATGGTVGKEGVTLSGVGGPGTRNVLKRAWLVRLRAGSTLDDSNFNLGLAVRLAPGKTFRKKRDTSRMVHLSKDVFLLYGPSVDQVFRSVAETDTPAVLNEMGLEFFRQFARLSA